MRFLRFFAAATLVLAGSAIVARAQAGGAGGAQAGGAPAAARPPAPPPLTMTIAGFGDGTDIPVKFTQAGTQTSPAISWVNTPAGTMSFVLHVHDMEVARNKTTDDMLHWLVWNIPGTETSLPEGIPMGATIPDGAFQLSAGGPVFRGPGAPATGPRHHYTFELFALDTKVDVQPETDPFMTWADVLKAMQGHILGKSVYVGLFHRPA